MIYLICSHQITHMDLRAVKHVRLPLNKSLKQSCDEGVKWGFWHHRSHDQNKLQIGLKINSASRCSTLSATTRSTCCSHLCLISCYMVYQQFWCTQSLSDSFCRMQNCQVFILCLIPWFWHSLFLNTATFAHRNPGVKGEMVIQFFFHHWLISKARLKE